MKRTAFIWMCIVCLAGAGILPLSGQQAISADRLVVSDAVEGQDTLKATGEAILSEPSSAHRYPGTGSMVVTEQGIKGNTQVSPNAAEGDIEAAERVTRIWEEIDRSGTELQHMDAVKGNSPWSFNTNVGTSFISFPRIGSAMNMYAAPRVNFAATERLAFHAGLTVGRTMPLGGLIANEDMNHGGITNNGMTNFSTYVAASYLLAENLVIHGSGSRSAFLVPVNGELQTVHFNDISVGATYNFGNFSIGATIHHSDAPVFGAPFRTGNSMYGAPLFW